MSVTSKDHKDPFKCPICEVHYSTSPDSDSAPSLLNCCGHSMCVGCVQKYRIPYRMSENGMIYEIQCAVCGSHGHFKEASAIAVCLVDVINEMEEKQKRKPFVIRGVEAEDLKSLECPVCAKTYGTIDDNTPYIQLCGHAMCTNCVAYRKLRRGDIDRYKYELQCTVCERWSLLNGWHDYGACIKDVVNWLNVKKAERAASIRQNQFKCMDCEDKCAFDKGFVCTDCSAIDGGKQRMLCANCIHDAEHEDHKFPRLLPIELQSMKEESRVNIQSKVANGKSEAVEVLETIRTLLDTVEECFSSTIDTIPMARKHSDGTAIVRGLRGNAMKFEEIMTTVIPSAADQKLLKDFIDQLKSSILPVKVEGESKRIKETQDERDGKRIRTTDKEEESEADRETEREEEGEREKKRRRLSDTDRERTDRDEETES